MNGVFLAARKVWACFPWAWPDASQLILPNFDYWNPFYQVDSKYFVLLNIIERKETNRRQKEEAMLIKKAAHLFENGFTDQIVHYNVG